MKINKDKTKIIHVRDQDPITQTTSEETSKVCKFTCPHLGCGYKFRSKRGMQTYAGRCKWSRELKVEKILECRGDPWSRQYKQNSLGRLQCKMGYVGVKEPSAS